MVSKLVAKNDANLALPPRFRQVLIELPLYLQKGNGATEDIWAPKLDFTKGRYSAAVWLWTPRIQRTPQYGGVGGERRQLVVFEY
ncbi:hypothetical protein TNCV_3819681 [Trichonephila clavipes]|nr:hypothetical protein TNCV_3819681 [Trichonephila clavipes]